MQKPRYKNMPGGKKVIVSGRFQVKKVYFRGGMAEGLWSLRACKIVQEFILDVYNFTCEWCHATPKINFSHSANGYFGTIVWHSLPRSSITIPVIRARDGMVKGIRKVRVVLFLTDCGDDMVDIRKLVLHLQSTEKTSTVLWDYHLHQWPRWMRLCTK